MGDPFDPKPKRLMEAAAGELPLDLQMGRDTPVTQPEPAEAAGQPPNPNQKRWYVTEAPVLQHGRTMGCPRCYGALGSHNTSHSEKPRPAKGCFPLICLHTLHIFEQSYLYYSM